MNKHFVTSKAKQLGQGMSEYIIITALIAVAAIGVFANFGDVVGNQTAAMAKEMAGEDASTDVGNAKDNAGSASTRANQKDTLNSYHKQN